MLFHPENKEQKGLFTFYFQQQPKRQTYTQLKYNQQQNISSLPQKQTLQTKSIVAEDSELKKPIHIYKKLSIPRFKTIKSKQRLKQSVIEMGKNTLINKPQIIHKPRLNSLKSKQLSQNSTHVHLKQGQVNLNASQQNAQNYSINYSSIDSSPLITRKPMASHKIPSANLKNHSFSDRNPLINLPSIYISIQSKKAPRPKRSLKSKLIQEALHTGDRARIKQIRDFLRGESSMKVMASQQLTKIQEQSVERSIRLFDYRQQKLLQLLKRFKKD